ncbi:NAP-domain-containing protein [Exidia glandulosa HHB12029]|nr:NAP-domain-containing protein [Exidia glandulosa HHB12029]
MSSNVPINQSSKTAPTPVNTPLATGVLSGGLSRPTVPDVAEEGEVEELSTGLGGATTALLSSLVQGKIAGLIGRSSGYIEALPVPIKLNVEALKGVDASYLEVYKEYKKELLALEKKYEEKYKPVFERRKAIVNGTAEASEEEIKKGEEVSKKDAEEKEEEYEPLEKGEKPAKEGIPDFWLTALRNHVGISDLITDRDAPCLSHLTDVRVVQLPLDKPGYRLEFEFSKNDWFENDVLTKTYYYREELDYSGDFMYAKAEGSEIKWKDDKDLTKSFEIKKQRNKNTNRTRLVRKAHPAESFFNFFSPPTPPADDEEDDEDRDEEELEELEDRLALDYQIGEDFKERIIPRAIDFFTGKALDYEDFDEDDEDDYEDLDEDDEDDDEDSEADSDDDVPVRRRIPRAAPAAQQNVDPQECKQQ